MAVSDAGGKEVRERDAEINPSGKFFKHQPISNRKQLGAELKRRMSRNQKKERLSLLKTNQSSVKQVYKVELETFNYQSQLYK